MTELNPRDQARIPVPPHGRWFHGLDSQKLMLEAYHEHSPPDALAVGWDTQYGGKMFGIYPPGITKDEFMHLLLEIPWAQRHCYELLVENVPCKAYADVEWIGPPEEDHATLKLMIAAMRAKIREVYSRDPAIYVCCGSRPAASSSDQEQMIKHSYHVVCDNIIFERNNDGQMKELFTTIPGFTWMDDVEEKPMIDSRVYTKNRHFRLPHCCKMGSQHTLERISGDPLLDEFHHDSQQWARDVQAVLPFFISNPARDDPSACVFVPTPSGLLERVVTNKRARTSSSSATGNQVQSTSTPTNKLFPVPLQIVQRLLVLAGDTVSCLGQAQYLPEEDQWKIQGDQRGKGRKCLATLGTTHSSNNCLLFVELFQSGFRVHYFCTASECSCHTKRTIIGYISMNSDTFEWQIALSPVPAQPDPTTHTNAMQIEESDEGMEPHKDDYEEEPTQVDKMQQDDEMAPVPDGPQRPGHENIGTDQDMVSDTGSSMGDEPNIPLVEPPIDVMNPALNSFEQVRERFEKYCAKIHSPPSFVVIRPTGKHTFFNSQPNLVYYFSNLFYFQPSEDEDAKEPFDKKLFITRWLKEENMRQCEEVVCDPSSLPGLGENFNVWQEFTAKTLPQNAALSSEEILELIKPPIRHIHEVVANDRQEDTDFNLDWLARILQQPQTPTRVAISLYGRQGVGKGIIFEWFRRHVLGLQCSYQTSKPERDLIGTFANGIVGKVLVQVDEVKSLHDYSDRLKDLITNQTVNYEKKGKDSIVLPNMANFIFTSNNANALTVSPDDRRFVLFSCSDRYKGNRQYFEDLGAHLMRPEVIRAFYDFLMARDLSKYPDSFEHHRPITAYYEEVQLNNIPVISRFISALVNSNYQDPQIAARDMYKNYVQFHTSGNYKFLLTETSFGRELKKVVGITKKKTNTCNVYALCHSEIKAYLENAKEYDPDAEYYHS